MSYSQFDAQSGQRAELDEGLRTYMNDIYTRMAAGVFVTAIVAFAVGSTPALLQLLMGGPQAFLFAFAPAIVLMFGFNPVTMSAKRLQGTFFFVSALYGISFSTIAFWRPHSPAIFMTSHAPSLSQSVCSPVPAFTATRRRKISPACVSFW